MGSRILSRASTKVPYTMRLAGSQPDIHAAQALRFTVFNLELGEGLDASWQTCRDEDPFDDVCDHLLVEHAGEVVGTYRLQTGTTASFALGYYAEGEFNLQPFARFRSEIVELGRACVARAHRNLAVLSLLWRGIIAYAQARQARYLLGCGSLTSQHEGEGAALYRVLSARHLSPPAWRTQPHPYYACALGGPEVQAPRPPKLLAAYLSLGATICAPPAIDRDFKTIDFLTLLDLQALSAQAQSFLGGERQE